MRTIEVNELIEDFDEVMRLVIEEGEIFEITKQGKIIARLEPVRKTKSSFQEKLEK